MIATQNAGELTKTMFPTGRRATIEPVLTAVAVLFLILSSHAAVADTGWQNLADISAAKVLPQGVEVEAGVARVRVTALSSNVVRVRYAPRGVFPADQSFAVLPAAFPQPLNVDVKQSEAHVTFSTGQLQVEILKKPLRIIFRDSKGNVISQDRPEGAASFNGPAFRLWKSMPEEEHYFGLGDKAGPLDRRNMGFTFWNTDAFGWQESTDPIYKSIPFVLAMRNASAYGLFFDNTYRSNFEFGKEFHDAFSFAAEGGELDYYFFYGPSPKRVISDFTTLVGRTPLPPLSALGYQQCRYSYYPEARVREIAGEFRKRKIPADIIYLDIDYQQNNRPFTVDRERFPNFEGMVSDLKAEGFKIVAITDLHLAKLPGYKPYDEGIKADYFVKNPDGSVYVGKVWPGDSVFPDFTRAAVRQWWGTLYSDFVKTGIRGFWNDMNEPSVFERADKTMPLDTVHNVEGRKTDHREIHNVFGMENARATYEGLRRLQPDIRPFVLTRAAYAGAQRYAATWTGDNSSTWNHMRISIPQLLNLGLSGYTFSGDDIGGFAGSPTPELLTRWMELGAFNVIYRNHGTKGSRDREPWVDGPEHEAIRRHYIETRYQLMPYIYTEMEEASRTGVPVMRPMFLEFPDDSTLQTNESEFMFGPRLLVAPKVTEFVGPYEVRLPAGEWYDFWTGARLNGQVQNGQVQMVDPPLDSLPVYVRGGTILPQQPIVQYTEQVPAGPLQISVYPGSNCRGTLYQDDGNTMAYTKGEFLRMEFTCDARPDSLHLTFSNPQGTYKPWWSAVNVEFFGIETGPHSVSVDGTNASNWKFDPSAHTLTLTVPGPPSTHEIVVEK
jgi:alpha-glucosidase